ncbi:MAG: tRNA threonylcarbamoyladenosine dehydratase [Verrucomicrobia bacterium]|nr:tRNA threonylcarbamoyladenosine dehydratase [Verrucomicrobiota bacterium]
MDSDITSRFSGVLRLYGPQACARLRSAHIAVVGIGGVGSWAVEALARSGVGRLTLIDLDDICVTNINRQIHATTQTVGMSKVEVMAERARAVYPDCHVDAIGRFFNAHSAHEILSADFSMVMDAIDGAGNKSLLIAECRRRGLAIIVSGSAGGRVDPTRIRTADLALTTHDRLLADVRRRLRHDHGFPSTDDPWGIPAVYTTELARPPEVEDCVTNNNGANTTAATARADRLNCEAGMGSSVCVTGAFGFAAASLAIAHIVRDGRASPATP